MKISRIVYAWKNFLRVFTFLKMMTFCQKLVWNSPSLFCKAFFDSKTNTRIFPLVPYSGTKKPLATKWSLTFLKGKIGTWVVDHDDEEWTFAERLNICITKEYFLSFIKWWPKLSLQKVKKNSEASEGLLD